MRFFNRFRKTRTASVLPQEVDDYYRAEKRGRRGAAFLLGIMTLILTVLFVLGVFFIGRYFYNKVRGNSSSNVSISTQSDKDKKSAAEKKSSDDKIANSDNASNPATTSNPQSSNTPTATPPVVPNTGDITLPRTGDEGM